MSMPVPEKSSWPLGRLLAEIRTEFLQLGVAIKIVDVLDEGHGIGGRLAGRVDQLLAAEIAALAWTDERIEQAGEAARCFLVQALGLGDRSVRADQHEEAGAL